MTLKEQISKIRKTGHVHGNWYLETYPDVARLGMEPAEHYLKYGAAMGRNPGKDFDTKFYLSYYPDVEETGMNPLLHFALFGKKENRRTWESKKVGIVARLSDYLWSSPEPAPIYDELLELLKDPKLIPETRFDILRKLAIRSAFDGDVLQAESLMSQVDTIAPAYSNTKSRRIIHAQIMMLLNKHADARAMVQEYMERPDRAEDPDATLMLSNTYEKDDERLALINAVYTRENLAPLCLLDPEAPLSLHNIQGDDVPPYTIDHGLVSIIMPIYQAEDTIATAIRSLCQQSYRNIEIIAVDDCSPDGTFDVIKRLAAEDPRIRPVQQKVNAGAYPARNRGLEIAQGVFITTHDADDWSHPQKIETQIKTLIDENVKGVVAHWVRVQPSLHITPDWRLSHRFIHWSHSTFLTRKSLYDELGSWDNVRISADTEMIWRMQAAFGRSALKKIQPHAPLALALNDESSLTRTKQTHVSTIYYGLRRFYREIAQYWHQRPDGLTEQGHAKRLAMIPDEMFRKPDGPVRFDLVLRGDCTDPKITRLMLDTLKEPEWADKSIGIDHYPDITRNPTPFVSGFFDVLSLPSVRLVVPGTSVEAAQEIDLNG